MLYNTAIKPIPKTLLPHSATLKIPQGTDEFGGVIFTETALLHIRAELHVRYSHEKNSRDDDAKSLFIFDCKNSSPTGLVPEVGMRIAYGGREYEIKEVKAVMAACAIHRYEMWGRRI